MELGWCWTAMSNAVHLSEEDTVLVVGAGAVGLAALMAMKLLPSPPKVVIAVDVVPWAVGDGEEVRRDASCQLKGDSRLESLTQGNHGWRGCRWRYRHAIDPITTFVGHRMLISWAWHRFAISQSAFARATFQAFQLLGNFSSIHRATEQRFCGLRLKMDLAISLPGQGFISLQTPAFQHSEWDNCPLNKTLRILRPHILL